MEMVLRVLKSIEFIEANLVTDLADDEFGIQTIARRAGFSPWHFQRIFVSVTGETVANYVRKRRLSVALEKLASTRSGILEIALDCRYETQESFTRAFKAQFGITPGQVRKGIMVSASNAFKPRLTSEYLEFLNKESVMEPRFADFPESTVVGYGAKFICIMSPDHNNETIIPPLWDRFLADSHRLKHRRSDRTLGCCISLERSNERRNHADECYYIACAEVDSAEEVPEGMEVTTIPAGRYAIFTHKGKLDTLEHTLRYIYGSWLLRSSVELRSSPDLEIYDERFVPDSDESEFDICVPVK